MAANNLEELVMGMFVEHSGLIWPVDLAELNKALEPAGVAPLSLTEVQRWAGIPTDEPVRLDLKYASRLMSGRPFESMGKPGRYAGNYPSESLGKLIEYLTSDVANMGYPERQAECVRRLSHALLQSQRALKWDDAVGRYTIVFLSGEEYTERKRLQTVHDPGVSGSGRAVGASNRVFVVHGHDEMAKAQLEAMLRRLGLDPVILHQQASGGLTLIDKFEKYSDVAAAVVLLTADDVGAAKAEFNALKPRARQNVVFELGFFYGKLERPRVICLIQAGVERPSDTEGIVYINFTDSANNCELDIRRELREIGFALKD